MQRKTLILALLLSLLLANLGTSFAQDDAAVDAATQAASSTADLVLAGWSSSVEEDATLRSLLEQFTAETGISVEFIASPNHPVTMQTAFASGDYANVFYIDSSILPDWVAAGVIDVGEGKIEDPEGFYGNLLDVFTIDDILYCPPKDFSTMALQYNKTLFDAAGLDYPTADWTWDDLKAAAEALTDAEAGVVGLITPPELPRFLPFLYQAGGSVIDESGNYAMNNDAAREAIEFYVSFAQAGTGGGATAVDAGWGGEAFGEGRAAMAMEGNWVINFLLQNYPELDWGIAEMPAGPAGKATMAFTVCYGVGAQNDNPEASWQLVNFLTGLDGQISTAEVSFGPMPSRPDSADEYIATWGPRAEGTNFDVEGIDAFVRGADYSYRWQLPVGWGPFVDTFNAALQRAFTGDLTADDVIFEAQLAADEVSN